MKRLICHRIFLLSLGVCAIFAFTSATSAQSTNQSFPTPITSNEISGRISARDIGDARLTDYFYTFNAAQGDVFINVVTANFNGDIDVFTADNLKPLTKITVYADDSNNETGRVVYLRQPTKLILRIEGRTPNDNAATFRIKFAGSFAPAVAANNAENIEPEIPTVKTDNQTDIRVNSVGTIIEVKPKPTPAPLPKVTIAETKPAKKPKTPIAKQTPGGEVKSAETVSKNQTMVTIEKTESPKEEEKTAEIQNEEKPSIISVERNPQNEAKIENQPKKDSLIINNSPETTADKIVVKKEPTVEKEPKTSGKTKSIKPLPAAALENIKLVVLLKDGTKIEHSMSEVLRFGVDRGILTIILKDGEIKRYSLLDVEKTTIE